jgi:predicted dehydrogenase
MSHADLSTPSDRSRREFLKLSGFAAAGATLAGSTFGQSCVHAAPAASPDKTKPIDLVRIGFVGVGNRGSHLAGLLLDMDGVEIRAVGDLVEDRAKNIQSLAGTKGKAKPEVYCQGERDFERMCDRKDLDLIVTATPWEWHTPICVAAMKAGKHAATEVPASWTIEQCWELVETSEKTGRHCVMLENVCYFRNVMMVLNMVRQGLLGELVHCECGYQHDVRGYQEDTTPGAKPSWRRQEALAHNGNLYPTHPIGPVAQWLNINRGDRFDYIVSVSSKSVGVPAYFKEKLGADHPLAREPLKQGDVNTSIIRTVNGSTVTLYYDTQLPRPYDLILRVQGTKGIYLGTLDQIYVDGRSPTEHTWEPIAPYAKEYDHPLWRQLETKAAGKGHGGGDYLVLYRLIEALRTGTAPDMDVYDAATWSVITPLSEQSVANRGRPVDFPDFTHGKWKTNPPLAVPATMPT